MSILITNYSPEYEKAHKEFVLKYWKRERARNPEYLYWKFRGTSPSPLKGLFLAIDGQKVVGISGYIPFEVNIGGKVYEAHWTCDLMVDHDYRGKNIAQLLYEEAKKNKIIIIGSAPSPAATKSLARSGFKFLPGSWKVSFPKNLYEILKLKRITMPWLKWIPNPFYYMVYIEGLFKKSAFEKISTAEFANLFHASKQINEIYTHISPAFQEWRFNPFKHFYPGVSTFADKKGNYYAGYNVKKVYYICDFHVQRFQDLKSIIQHIYQQFKLGEIDLIRFMVNEFEHPKWMYWRGFIPFKSNTNIVYFTEDQFLLEELKNKKYYYTYLDSDENI